MRDGSKQEEMRWRSRRDDKGPEETKHATGGGESDGARFCGGKRAGKKLLWGELRHSYQRTRGCAESGKWID